MAHFYFHLFNDVVSRDDEGLELTDVAAAMRHAAASAREMAAQSVREGHLVLDHHIDVTDDEGAMVGTVHFRDVVEVRRTAASG